MPSRPSEIRAFLLRYAMKNQLIVKEHVSPSWESGGKTAFYCHIQSQDEIPRSATAVSVEGFDNALAMAFMNFLEPTLDFLPIDK